MISVQKFQSHSADIRSADELAFIEMTDVENKATGFG